MKLLLVSTCGTSVLTNGASDEVRRWLVKIANHRELAAADASRLSAHAEQRRDLFAKSDDAARRQLSAEWAGMGAVLDRYRPAVVQHVLVHTDTEAGEAARDIIASALRDGGVEAQAVTADRLRTDDPIGFHEAVAELTRTLESYKAWRENGWLVYFNLTGGFKAINGYLQALGMFYADRCGFLFEGSRSLMEIPRLPARLSEADDIRAYIDVFRKLEAGYSVQRVEARRVPETLLHTDKARVTRSVWGADVWARVRKALLAERLLDPLSPKLTLKPAVEDAFKGAPADLRVQINEALDALSAHLDGVQKVMKSNTFKKMKGKGAAPSTHEMYVTSGPGAKRLFGHYQGAQFVVDAVGRHL
jgi:putative CRISPR-associated protein (TIGR02619 family)